MYVFWKNNLSRSKINNLLQKIYKFYWKRLLLQQNNIGSSNQQQINIVTNTEKKKQQNYISNSKNYLWCIPIALVWVFYKRSMNVFAFSYYFSHVCILYCIWVGFKGYEYVLYILVYNSNEKYGGTKDHFQLIRYVIS